MFKCWLKKRLLPAVVISFILSLAAIFLCGAAINMRAELNTKSSIYTSSTVDFIAPSPSLQQINEIEEMQFVDAAIGYYESNFQVVAKGSTISQNIVLIDDLTNRNDTLFCDSRAIKVSDDAPLTAYIDYAFSKKADVGLGDSLQIEFGTQAFEYVVCGIFETNTLSEGGAVLIEYSGELKSAIEQMRETALPYSGVFVSANDISQCRNYFMQEYKPMALLRSRDEFDSDEAYQIHVSGFYSTDFSNQITDMAYSYDTIEAQMGDLNDGYYTFSALSGIAVLCAFIIFGIFCTKNKSERILLKAFKSKGVSVTNIRAYYFGSLIIFALLLIVFLSGGIAIYISNISYYIKLQMIAFSLVIVGIAYLLGVVLSTVVNIMNTKVLLKKANDG